MPEPAGETVPTKEGEGACENFGSYKVRLHALSFSLASARQRLACGLVSQKFAWQTKGKTIINRFLTPSRHFVTSAGSLISESS